MNFYFAISSNIIIFCDILFGKKLSKWAVVLLQIEILTWIHWVTNEKNLIQPKIHLGSTLKNFPMQPAKCVVRSHII